MTEHTRRKPHHHGNLREALIEGGIEILTEGGLPALTLRACAARARVSHAAPAHHFKGLPDLLTAIAARGFGIFTSQMIAEREKSGTDPRARLQAICRGYLGFATENPALFTLMFNTIFEITDCPEHTANSNAAYRVLAECCAPFKSPTAGPEGNEIMVWSLVHGYANLLLSGRVGSPDAHISTMRFEDILPELELR